MAWTCSTTRRSACSSIDRIEAFHGSDANGQAWEVEGWYGNDVNKLWLRSEGERSGGALEDANLEAFWNRTITAFWSTQLGVRHDFGEGPSRTWAAVGVQGLAPYWFELEATAYTGAAGRTAARVRAHYELLLTQRLILQPEAEINLYGQNDPARHIGNGLSDVQFGLRLRYEISRQFAPYIGVNWIRRVGTTADYARDDLPARSRPADRRWHPFLVLTDCLMWERRKARCSWLQERHRGCATAAARHRSCRSPPCGRAGPTHSRHRRSRTGCAPTRPQWSCWGIAVWRRSCQAVGPWDCRRAAQMRAARKRNALVTTETDDRLIASAAIIGLSSSPKAG